MTVITARRGFPTDSVAVALRGGGWANSSRAETGSSGAAIKRIMTDG